MRVTRARFLVLLTTLLAVQAHALYDPEPDRALAELRGSWAGTLIYLDYSGSEQLVTLSTRLEVSLAGPADLILFYTFDDGPGKTVYSYERMTFKFGASILAWQDGLKKSKPEAFRIVSREDSEQGTRIVFDKKEGKQMARFTLQFNSATLSLVKEEINSDGVGKVRSTFRFSRLEVQEPSAHRKG
jgi:hypothetical protein